MSTADAPRRPDEGGLRARVEPRKGGPGREHERGHDRGLLVRRILALCTRLIRYRDINSYVKGKTNIEAAGIFTGHSSVVGVRHPPVIVS